MVETFGLRLAAGFVFALLLLPRGMVAERFYRIHLIIVLCFLGVVGVFAWGAASDDFWLPFGLAAGAALFGTWSWSIREAAGSRYAALVLTLLALLASLWLRPRETLAPAAHAALFAQDATAAAYLGLALTAMLLGHWYLIAPNLSITPLLRLLTALFVATGLRSLSVGAGLWMATDGRFDFGYLGWLWLALRVLAGLVAAPALFWMAWESAKIRSTQSATGILYAADVLAVVGELTDQLLMAHLAAGA
jgi:hypothetical protein